MVLFYCRCFYFQGGKSRNKLDHPKALSPGLFSFYPVLALGSIAPWAAKENGWNRGECCSETSGQLRTALLMLPWISQPLLHTRGGSELGAKGTETHRSYYSWNWESSFCKRRCIIALFYSSFPKASPSMDSLPTLLFLFTLYDSFAMYWCWFSYQTNNINNLRPWNSGRMPRL